MWACKLLFAVEGKIMWRRGNLLTEGIACGKQSISGEFSTTITQSNFRTKRATENEIQKENKMGHKGQ